MITKDSFPDLLAALGFSKHGKLWHKTLNGATLGADFSKAELLYPEAQRQTIAAAPARKQAIMQHYL